MNELTNISIGLSQSEGKLDLLSDLVSKYNKFMVLNIYESSLSDSKSQIEQNKKDLESLHETWNIQDYYELNKSIEKYRDSFAYAINYSSMLESNLSEIFYYYNQSANELTRIREVLFQIQQIPLADDEQAELIGDEIKNFNNVLSIFEDRNDVMQKKQAVESLNVTVSKLNNDLMHSLIEESTNKTIEVDINYALLCEINNTCITRPSIQERAGSSNFSLFSACEEISDLNNIYLSLNITNSLDVENASNSTIALLDMRNKIIDKYLYELPDNDTNSEIIKNILVQKRQNDLPASDLNDTSEILAELVRTAPKPCEYVNVSEYNLMYFNPVILQSNKSFQHYSIIEFQDIAPKCCIFGNCADCCIDESCKNENYPVIFVHGHAFNKDTAADYSLDAFNKIQKNLETDGYINAGSISLYTAYSGQGVWGLSENPVSVKVSYYLDLFQQPDNYVVVQTKSENIETYAVRLKEIIDTVKFKTGKDKVIIVSHSMGGLVARRYIQLFGSDNVDKLILISVPNKGITGAIADYCTITGEKLECRDMNSDSLFMNKLNRGSLPDIETYNIIGVGCSMKDGTGDGVVTRENAEIKGVTNYVINGTCRGSEVLHTGLLDIDKYPKVYKIIKEILTGN
jgi:uncharacterized alpha/beta hydrolase family protein